MTPEETLHSFGGPNRACDWNPTTPRLWHDTGEPVDMKTIVRVQRKLAAAFPPEQVGKLEKRSKRSGFLTVLDYVGHGAVTERLNDIDPLWWWRPVSVDGAGQPLFQYDNEGNAVGLWLQLHLPIIGLWRPGFGDCPPSQESPEKVLIGDALRNAGMRFGIALSLWVKGHDPEDSPDWSTPTPSGYDDGSAPVRRQRQPKPSDADKKAADEAEAVSIASDISEMMLKIRQSQAASDLLEQQLDRRFPDADLTGAANWPLADLKTLKALCQGAVRKAERDLVDQSMLDDMPDAGAQAPAGAESDAEAQV